MLGLSMCSQYINTSMKIKKPIFCLFWLSSHLKLVSCQNHSQNNKQKNRLFSDLQEENNRLLFAETGIDDQGLYKQKPIFCAMIKITNVFDINLTYTVLLSEWINYYILCRDI